MALFPYKKYLPRTLFGRSLLILIVPIVLIQTITAGMFLDRHWSKVTARLSYAVAGEIVTLANIVQDNPDSAYIAQMTQNLDLKAHFIPAKAPTRASARAINHKYYGWESLVAASLTKELHALTPRPFTVDLNLREKRVHVKMALTNGVLIVTFPGRRLFSSSTYIFLLWMLGTSALLLMVAVLFMRGQIRPIRRLAVAANKFGRGQDMPTFRPTGAREVRQAAQAFIDMRLRIKHQMEQRTLMLAGISHDLRTPLTRLKLNLEMLSDGADKTAMQGDIADMQRMIDGYLNFVQDTHKNTHENAHKSTPKNTMENIDIRAFLGGIVDDARRQNITIHTGNMAANLGFIHAAPSALRRAIMNVVDNAARYGGNAVWLSAYKDDDHIRICVEDNGAGLDGDELENVLRPFYRVDDSRNLNTGGTGLGLSITQDIAAAHGGKLTLSDSKTHGGLCACINLPL